MLLLGGGIDRKVTASLGGKLAKLGVPVQLSWNAADRLADDRPMFFGRPNTWGQRYTNMLLQQADLIIALGTRLGMQRTGFNWQEFGKAAKIVHVDCDSAELEKGQPNVARGLCCDANPLLAAIADSAPLQVEQWVSYCQDVKAALPLNGEPANQTMGLYLALSFVLELSEQCTPGDIIPCSGGAFTTADAGIPPQEKPDHGHRQGPGLHGLWPFGRHRSSTGKAAKPHHSGGRRWRLRPEFAGNRISGGPWRRSEDLRLYPTTATPRSA